MVLLWRRRRGLNSGVCSENQPQVSKAQLQSSQQWQTAKSMYSKFSEEEAPINPPFKYDADLAGILEEEDEFEKEGRGRYQVIDAAGTLDGKIVRFERDEIKDKGIQKWASQPVSNDSTLFHLKLLCFEADNSDEAWNSTLPCSKTAYEAIKSAWKLPDWTLRYLDNRGGNGLVLPYGALTESKYLKRFGLASKNANSHHMFVIYDPDRRTTNVLIREGINIDFKVDELLDRLERSQEYMCFPVLAPFLLIEAFGTEANDIQSNHQNRMDSVQKKQDFFAFDSNDDDDDQDNGDGEDNTEDDKDSIADLDLIDLGRELTKVYLLSRGLQRSLEDSILWMSLLRNMHQMFLDGLKPADREQVEAAWHDLFERILLVQAQAQKNLEYTYDNQGEVQASMQTMNALIGSNDSNLNYESAQASVRIAEDSRRVAILARQDSTDMRVIAGTTLFFLPATFVATLFSTNFFNFKPSNGLVSPWIWMYFAVSAILTVPVMLAWRFLSKARAKETAQILKVKDVYEDEEQRIDEKADTFTGGLSSGNALQDIKNRLSKRKKTPTMEMEEK